MTDKMAALARKYKSLIRYGIFGVLTTIINIVVYETFYKQVGWSNIASNILAWVIAVLFAYVTNKLWVFESKSTETKVLLYELATFFGCRLATGILDLGIMYLTVDRFAWNSTLMKCTSNVIVIIANYAVSKLVIFQKKQA